MSVDTLLLRLAVQLEADVDAVAGGTGHLADDHPLRLGQRIDQRALADVPAADNRHLHHRLFGRRRLDLDGRQPLEDRLNQLALAPVLQHAPMDHLPAQLVELVRLAVQLGVVGLVGQAQHRHADVAKPLGHLLVQGGDTLPGVHHEEDEGRRLDGHLDLLLDGFGQVVDVLDAHAAGVDQLHEALAELDELGQAVARHARRRIDDGDPASRKPVQHARLAHVGPADDGNLRYPHPYIIVTAAPARQTCRGAPGRPRKIPAILGACQ
jgi:hypothetical protein